MFEVGIVGHFEAAHSLRGNFGPARRRHGHTYRVEAAVRSSSLRDDGTLIDIGDLQNALQDALAGLHYRDLDELDVFGGRNTTAEVVAQYLFEQIALCLEKENGLEVQDTAVDEDKATAGIVRESPLRSLKIRVWESPAAWATYEETIE